MNTNIICSWHLLDLVQEMSRDSRAGARYHVSLPISRNSYVRTVELAAAVVESSSRCATTF